MSLQIEICEDQIHGASNAIKCDEYMNEVEAEKVTACGWNDSINDGFMMRQTTTQCCRCCCLQPDIDWTIHTYKSQQSSSLDKHQLSTPVFNIKETATFWGRTCSYCYPAFRKTIYSVRKGEDQEGEVVLKFQKSWSFPINFLLGYADNGPIRCPCCCFLPYLETIDGKTNDKLGSAKVICDAHPLWCPKFAIYDESEQPMYKLQPDLCCYEQCYVCKRGKGAKCCYMPFFIRDYHTGEREGDEIALIDLYVGMTHECCTKRNLYSVKFPSKMKKSMKPTIMGAALLYDICLNEQNQ